MEKPLKIPKSKFNISRDKMPQITSDHIGDFLAGLKKKGIHHEVEHVPAGKLKPTQHNFDHSKIRDLMGREWRETPGKAKRYMIVSKDHYVLDGHHRYLAALNQHGDKHKMEVMRVHTPMKDLLKHANSYKHAEYRKDTSNLTSVSEELAYIKSLVRKILY